MLSIQPILIDLKRLCMFCFCSSLLIENSFVFSVQLVVRRHFSFDLLHLYKNLEIQLIIIRSFQSSYFDNTLSDMSSASVISTGIILHSCRDSALGSM